MYRIPLGPFAEDLVNQGIHIEALSRKPGFDASLISQIRQHIKAHKIDIIHCHQYTLYVYGALGALMTPAKVIFTEHGRFYPDSTTWKRKVINPSCSDSLMQRRRYQRQHETLW
ncbi:glycosyltransferase [Paraglaciecola sp. Hal342]